MGNIPSGQKSRGTPAGQSRNPKTTNRPDSIGSKGDGTAGLPVAGARDDDTGWKGTDSPNRSKGGSASGVPSDSEVNPYVAPSTGSGRRTSNPGANRQRFGIDGQEGLNTTSGVEGGEARQTPRGTGQQD